MKPKAEAQVIPTVDHDQFWLEGCPEFLFLDLLEAIEAHHTLGWTLYRRSDGKPLMTKGKDWKPESRFLP